VCKRSSTICSTISCRIHNIKPTQSWTGVRQYVRANKSSCWPCSARKFKFKFKFKFKSLARELMAAWHRKVRLGPHHAVKGRTRPGWVESRAGIVRAACARFAGNREIPSFVGRWSRLPRRRHPTSPSVGRLLLRAGCSRLERAAALRPYRTRHRPCRHLRHRRPPRRHPPSPSAQ
jgi:hypothetical protein